MSEAHPMHPKAVAMLNDPTVPLEEVLYIAESIIINNLNKFGKAPSVLAPLSSSYQRLKECQYWTAVAGGQVRELMTPKIEVASGLVN